jgi:hypothetical protein
MDLNDTCLFFCKDMDFLFQSDDGVQAIEVWRHSDSVQDSSARGVARLRTDVRFASKIPRALALANKAFQDSFQDSARQRVARLRRHTRLASKIPRALAVANKVNAALESLDPQGFDDLFSTLSWIFDKLKEENMGTVSCTKFYNTVKRSLVELIQPWASVMQPDTILAPDICWGIVAFVFPPRFLPDENMGLDAMCLFFCKNMEFLFLPDGKDSKRSNDDSAQEMAKLRKSPRFANKIPRALALASQVKMTMQNHLTSEPEP